MLSFYLHMLYMKHSFIYSFNKCLSWAYYCHKDGAVSRQRSGETLFRIEYMNMSTGWPKESIMRLKLKTLEKEGNRH